MGIVAIRDLDLDGAERSVQCDLPLSIERGGRLFRAELGFDRDDASSVRCAIFARCRDGTKGDLLAECVARFTGRRHDIVVLTAFAHAAVSTTVNGPDDIRITLLG